jgi:ribosomal protein S18 acetylase RimI-like enzyme
VPTADISESNAQFRGAWRHFAVNSPKGEVADTPEVFIASSNASWAMLNMAFLPKPVETEAALERSVAAAASRLASNKAGWIYVACDDWLAPSVREKAPALFEAHGLRRTMNAMGMVAERLLPPTRLLPALEVRQATGAETLRHIADINAIVYGSPLEAARESVVIPAIFQGDCRGYVGFAEGKAISVAAVIRVDGIAYVGFVATLAEYRGRGYAEAVMRHGLEEARQHWGLERTVLHSTDAGHSTYLRMGYRDVTNFGFYMPVPGH